MGVYFFLEMETVQPAAHCHCAPDCPIHGVKAAQVFLKNATLKRDIINLAGKYEGLYHGTQAETVSEAIHAAQDVWRGLWKEFATEVWTLLGECMCRTHSCQHPASFHKEDGSCTLCRKDACWS